MTTARIVKMLNLFTRSLATDSTNDWEEFYNLLSGARIKEYIKFIKEFDAAKDIVSPINPGIYKKAEDIICTYWNSETINHEDILNVLFNFRMPEPVRDIISMLFEFDSESSYNEDYVRSEIMNLSPRDHKILILEIAHINGDSTLEDAAETLKKLAGFDV